MSPLKPNQLRLYTKKSIGTPLLNFVKSWSCYYIFNHLFCHAEFVCHYKFCDILRFNCLLLSTIITFGLTKLAWKGKPTILLPLIFNKTSASDSCIEALPICKAKINEKQVVTEFSQTLMSRLTWSQSDSKFAEREKMKRAKKILTK